MSATPPAIAELSDLDRRLDALVGGPNVRAEVAALLGAHHAAARHRIGSKLANGLGGVEVARLYCQAADEILIALWRFTTETL